MKNIIIRPGRRPAPGARKFSAAAALVALASCFVFLVSCASAPEQTQSSGVSKELLETMTPEERANFEALQQEKERLQVEHRKKPAPAPAGKKLWKRHSAEKREKLDDISTPVLLRESSGSSVFPWKKDAPPRSEKLQEEQQKRRAF